jgi:hypothetical protein
MPIAPAKRFLWPYLLDVGGGINRRLAGGQSCPIIAREPKGASPRAVIALLALDIVTGFFDDLGRCL